MSDTFREENKETFISDNSLRPHHGRLVFFLGSLGVGLWVIVARLGDELAPAVGVCLAGIGLVFGILAWIIGVRDLREMKNQKMDPAGKGMTHFGMAWGSIMIIMIICVLAATLIAMLIMPPAGKN
jgi:tellurite resistance protein TehA-like permease